MTISYTEFPYNVGCKYNPIDHNITAYDNGGIIGRAVNYCIPEDIIHGESCGIMFDPGREIESHLTETINTYIDSFGPLTVAQLQHTVDHLLEGLDPVITDDQMLSDVTTENVLTCVVVGYMDSVTDRPLTQRDLDHSRKYLLGLIAERLNSL